MRCSFFCMSERTQRRVFLALLVLTLLALWGIEVLDRPLKTEASPHGIVSFELARTPAVAWHILEAWGPEGRVYAGLSLGLDYLFLFLYASTLALGCTIVSCTLPRGLWAAAGCVLAWAQVGAACLDAVENYALIRVLLGSTASGWPAVAFFSAVGKFALVVPGILYVLGGFLWLGVKSLIKRT